MIDFIFGDAGSGKSGYIYEWLTNEAIAHPEQRYYLFVPEQNTLKAQRELIAKSSRHGMLNLDVLSFQLLAYRVMDELGIEKPVMIDDISKAILIRRAAAENADKLKVYGSKINSDGFISRMKSLISEFCQYDISTDKLRDAENAELPPLLKDKLSDIAVIYESFRSMLNEKTAIPEDLSYMLLSYISESRLLADAVIVFDGYTGFTPIQERLLEHIIPSAARCRFAVTIPMSAHPYSSSVQSVDRAGKVEQQSGDDCSGSLTADNGMQTADNASRTGNISSPKINASDIYMLSRETVSRVMRIAERSNIPTAGETEIPYSRQTPNVSIVKAADRVDEVRYMARQLRLNAMTKGIRYKRMAVAVSDLAGYTELIRNELTREAVPFFIDDRSEAVSSPAVSFIRAALKVIVRGYRSDDITAFFKNPLISCLSARPELQNSADLADNYLRKTGKRGRRIYTELAQLLDISGVTQLEEQLKAAQDIREMSVALRQFTTEAGLQNRVEIYAADIEKEGFAREAGECRRFNTAIGELLDRLSVILGDSSCSIEEFRKLLDAGFADMKGGAIPETMDMVLIGDIKRSRLDDIDVLFVLGANDGQLPQAVTGGGIFTDYERIEIMNQGIELAPDDKTDSIIQRFYLKLLLNKPTQELIISYASADGDGKAMRASSVINELMRGDYGDFPDITSTELNAQSRSGMLKMHINAIDDGRISSEADALMYLAAAIRSAGEDDEEFFDTYRALKTAGRGAELDKIEQAASIVHKDDRLSQEAASLLYHELLQGSVTRIEGFESCPYSQFARYGLELRERDSFNIRSLDIGNIYHGALDMVFKELKAKKQDIRDIDETELCAMADAASDRIINEYNENIMGSTARNQYISDRVRRIARRTLKTLKRQSEAGDFITRDTEYEFKLKEDKLMLRGKIDRLDVCEADGRSLVRIIDYKSGSKTFSLSRIINGLDLQLITYMDRALKLIGERTGDPEHVIPAGMFYYHIDDPAVDYKSGITADVIETEKTQKLRLSGAVMSEEGAAGHMDRAVTGGNPEDKKSLAASGVIGGGSELLSRDEFAGLMQYADKRIADDTVAILGGDISIKPYKDGNHTGCDYCSYRSLCGFDVNVDGFGYRHIYKTGMDDITVSKDKQ